MDIIYITNVYLYIDHKHDDYQNIIHAQQVLVKIVFHNTSA